jgi:hypothetical protein
MLLKAVSMAHAPYLDKKSIGDFDVTSSFAVAE